MAHETFLHWFQMHETAALEALAHLVENARRAIDMWCLEHLDAYRGASLEQVVQDALNATGAFAFAFAVPEWVTAMATALAVPLAAAVPEVR